MTSSSAALARPCPFCAGHVEGALCPECKRDPTTPRRVCSSCKKMTPTAEAPCCHCKALQTSEMVWKVPVIIGLFTAAFIVSLLIALAR